MASARFFLLFLLTATSAAAQMCHAVYDAWCLEWHSPKASMMKQHGCTSGPCDVVEGAEAVVKRLSFPVWGDVALHAYKLADVRAPTKVNASTGARVQKISFFDLLHGSREDHEQTASTTFRDREPEPKVAPGSHPRESTAREPLAPILLVTGLTGTDLYADVKINHGSCGPHFFCSCHLKGTRLWMEEIELLPGLIDCTFHRMHLEWNMTSKSYRDFGVNVYTRHYGEPNCTGCTGRSQMFSEVRSALWRMLGYNESLFADVVFDFRLGPREWAAHAGSSSFYQTGDHQRLRALVEEKKRVFGERVLLASISEGGLLVNSFLAAQSPAWKNANILGWVSMATPFAGAKEIGLHFLSGDFSYQQLIPWLDAGKFRDASEGWSGLITVAPVQSSLPSDTEPFVVTPSEQFSIASYRNALMRAGRSVTADVWNQTIPLLVGPTVPPGVPTLCMFGTGVRTISKIRYATDDLSDRPRLEYDYLGDGTVHHDSLTACERWHAPNVTVKAYQNVSHTGMLTHIAALEDLVRWVHNVKSNVDGS